MPEEKDLVLKSTNGRVLIVSSASVPVKGVKDNGGIAVMTQKRGQKIEEVKIYEKGMIENENRLRTRTLPAAGNKPLGAGQQDGMDLD